MKANFFKSNISNLKPVKIGGQGPPSSGGGSKDYHVLPPDDQDDSDKDQDSDQDSDQDIDQDDQAGDKSGDKDGSGDDSNDNGQPSKVEIKGNPKPIVDVIPEDKSLQEMFGADANALDGSDKGRPVSMTKEELKKAIERAKQNTDIEQSAGEGKPGVGKGMGGKRMVDSDIFPVKTDWAAILMNLLKKSRPGPPSFSKIHKKTFGVRYSGKPVMRPGRTSEPEIGRIVVAIDTSGSISNRIITGFLSDLRRLFSQFKSSETFAVKILLWSDGIYNASPEFDSSEFKSASSWVLNNVRSGGTSISNVIDYINTSIPNLKSQYVATIWFTDGEISDLNKPLPDMDNIFVLQGYNSSLRTSFLNDVQKYRPKNKKITVVRTDY